MPVHATRRLLLVAALALAACGGGPPPTTPVLDGGVDAPADAMIDAAIDSPPAANTTLAALATSVGALNPPFEPEVTDYDLDLLLAEGELVLTPAAAAPAAATITVDGVATASGAPSLALDPPRGDSIVAIVVTDGDDATTYRVHVHRGVDVLTGLIPSTGALEPGFEAATTSYSLPLPLAAATLGWTPTLATPGRATVTVDGVAVASGASSPAAALPAGDATAIVTVTPRTRPAHSYRVDVVHGAELLRSLAVTNGGAPLTDPITPAFAPDHTAYAASVGLFQQSITIAAEPRNPSSTISIAGGPIMQGPVSSVLPLNLGLTSFAIVVTAPGGTRATYTLDVTRGQVVAQRAYLKASNTGAGDQFGGAVALAGDTLAIGAIGESSAAIGVDGNQADDSAAGSGAVYVFRRSGGAWVQEAYLKASNTGAGDRFGSALALAGDTLVVGAPNEDSAALGVGGNQSNDGLSGSGAAYVFTRTGNVWTQQVYLKSSHPTGAFGASLALSGDTLAVGAPFDSTEVAGGDPYLPVPLPPPFSASLSSGAVDVFVRSGTTWSHQQFLKAANAGFSDQFGRAVALSGDTLAVGAPSESSSTTFFDQGGLYDNDADGAGAVYVFVRTGGSWAQEAFLKAYNTGAADHFGTSVALVGGELAVGAPYEDSSPSVLVDDDDSLPDSGRVYTFLRGINNWQLGFAFKASNAGAGDHFGAAVALSGGFIAVGSPEEASSATGVGGDLTSDAAPSSGAVYMYRVAVSPTPQWYFKASNTGAYDRFGGAIGLAGDSLVVGAIVEDSAATGVGGDSSSEGASDAGAVYLFR